MTTAEYLSTQLQSDETIIQTVRRHGVVTTPAVLVGVVLILLDFFLLAWFFGHGTFGVIGFVLLLVFGTVALGRAVFVWRQNVFAITNQRLIYFDQRGVFEQHVSETALENVKDVRYVVKGLWGTMFRFGTLVIQVTGVTEPLNVRQLPQPMDVQRAIIDQQRHRRPEPSTGGQVVDVRRNPNRPV